MKTYRFANGDLMPMLGLGTWKSEPGEVGQAIQTAIKLGYRHLDCAPIYQNEPEVGQAIAEGLSASGLNREDLWITSKLWCDAHARKDVRPALERTLKDLRLDTLDLYLVHWPVALKIVERDGELTETYSSLEEQPLEETWAGMEEVLQAGLCRHIGVSNFSIKKIKAVSNSANVLPEVNQVELHPYLQQGSLVGYCQEHDILVTAYSPLGSKDRPESMQKTGEPTLLEDPTILTIAKNHQATAAQVLIQWALARGTSVIPKSVNPARLRENFDAMSLQLTESELQKIAALDRHRRYVLGDFWTTEGSPYTLQSLWDEAP